MQVASMILSLLLGSSALAGVDSALTGAIQDADHVAISKAQVQVLDSAGKVVKETPSNETGEFQIFPLEFGTYQVIVHAKGYADFQASVTLSSGTPSRLQVVLAPADAKEIVVNVREKRNLVQITDSGSKKDLNRQQIAELPQGHDISLPKLISSTTPGVVAGPFGQMFIRGNHANIQYQIDGVQLPEATSGSFSDAFSPRNIDHMEIITGGIPAEYGERLSAVMNIITISGPEKTSGDAEISYGSYNSVTPQVMVGGSNQDGNIHYFASAKYNQTNRAVDTPQPLSYADEAHGGQDAIHDAGNSDVEFVRVDDILDNENKLTVIGFNSREFIQIPTFPSNFLPTDAYFQPGYTDPFGNQQTPASQPLFTWAPPTTNDTTTENNAYLEVVWKHTFSESSFLQIAPYYKVATVNVTNDLANDLATVGSQPISGAAPDSFLLSRTTNNYGLKTDYTYRADERNLWKAGFQLQNSQSITSNMSIWTSLTSPPFTFSGLDNGNLEAVYIQDSYTVTPNLTLNMGLRNTEVQFQSDQIYSSDGLLQPRIGLEYLLSERTKLHAFYGKLFQPAPFENLREAFTVVGGGLGGPYNIKAESDDYFEAGVSQQVGEQQLMSLVAYYKNAANMLDDTGLLNTSLAQPYNYSFGYATGVELSIVGELAPNWSEFFNYAYEDARGEGISGGIFAFNSANIPPNQYLFLDHVQLDTATAGLTYKKDSYWSTLQGLYGSGLRTGPNNANTLPTHLTFDFTVGYKFIGDSGWKGTHVAVDWLNITNLAYPITINNGFNGSHYAAGAQYFVHLGREF